MSRLNSPSGSPYSEGTGKTLLIFSPLAAELLQTTSPSMDTRNFHPVLDYDATADETAYFSSILPRRYQANGVSVLLHWTSTATSGTTRWEVAWERMMGGQDIDSDSFATAKSTGTATSGTSGVINTSTISFTNAEIDGVLIGELFRILVRRDANGTTGTDDMAADAELMMIEIKENN